MSNLFSLRANTAGSAGVEKLKDTLYTLSVRTSDDEDDDILNSGRYIITTCKLASQDHLQATTTVGKETYYYLTGRSPDTLELSGMLYFPADKTESQDTFVKVIRETWDKYKVSEYKKPVRLLIGNIGYWFYLHTVQIEARTDPQDGVHFSMQGIGERK